MPQIDKDSTYFPTKSAKSPRLAKIDYRLLICVVPQADETLFNNIINNDKHMLHKLCAIVPIHRLLDCTGDCEPEIKRPDSIIRECVMALDRNLWRSRISVGTKVRLFNFGIL